MVETLSTSKFNFSFNILMFLTSDHLSSFLLSIHSIFPQYLLFLYEKPKNPYILLLQIMKEPLALSMTKSGTSYTFLSLNE